MHIANRLEKSSSWRCELATSLGWHEVKRLERSLGRQPSECPVDGKDPRCPLRFTPMRRETYRSFGYLIDMLSLDRMGTRDARIDVGSRSNQYAVHVLPPLQRYRPVQHVNQEVERPVPILLADDAAHRVFVNTAVRPAVGALSRFRRIRRTA